jgi:pheromone shutdown protein TraB
MSQVLRKAVAHVKRGRFRPLQATLVWGPHTVHVLGGAHHLEGALWASRELRTLRPTYIALEMCVGRALTLLSQRRRIQLPPLSYDAVHRLWGDDTLLLQDYRGLLQEIEAALLVDADLTRKNAGTVESPEQLAAIDAARFLDAPIWLTDMPRLTQIMASPAGSSPQGMPHNLAQRDAYIAAMLRLRIASVCADRALVTEKSDTNKPPESFPVRVALVVGSGHVEGVEKAWLQLSECDQTSAAEPSMRQAAHDASARLVALSALPSFPCTRKDDDANNELKYLLSVRCRSSADIDATLAALPAALRPDDAHYVSFLNEQFDCQESRGR